MARRLQPYMYLPSCSRPEQVATGPWTVRRTAIPTTSLLSHLFSSASRGPERVWTRDQHGSRAGGSRPYIITSRWKRRCKVSPERCKGGGAGRECGFRQPLALPKTTALRHQVPGSFGSVVQRSRLTSTALLLPPTSSSLGMPVLACAKNSDRPTPRRRIA